jgi:hypothetical protein
MQCPFEKYCVSDFRLERNCNISRLVPFFKLSFGSFPDDDGAAGGPLGVRDRLARGLC